MTSNSAILQGRRPLVLLVEDKPESLRRRKGMFESFDCTAVAVGSKRLAMRELEQTPLVDLVVTDINMPETDVDADDDKSGIELARHVRANFAEVPVAGYSAHFEEGVLQEQELAVFDAVFEKGSQTVDVLEAQVQRCVDLAMRSREQRVARREELLDRLRRDYEVSSQGIEIVRRLALDPDVDTPSSMVEGPLREAGYRLRLVAANELNASEPFVAWVQNADWGTYVEVYGKPDLHASGDSERQAFAALAELMLLVSQDAQNDQQVPLSARLKSVYEFVSRIVAGRSSGK